ncbi:hypothetical protein [Duganella vulcania]|uniref:hypothetical protein n=1 Tax=Duganella vulcania TaxID=2692166 RepID=UPI001C2D0E68|nr:hypothetical protein [Duganella vulcania]
MKIRNLHLAAISAALGLALTITPPLAAAAAVSAETSISNVQLKVVDLTPDDGQAGGINYFDRESALYTNAGQTLHDYQNYKDLRAATATVSSGSAQAWTSHSGVPGEIQGRTQSNGYDAASTFTYQNASFWLMPHTSVSVSGHIAGFVQSVAGLPYASANTSAQVYFWNLSAHTGYLARVYKELTLDSSPSGSAFNEDFNLYYANDTDKAIAIRWASVADTYAAASAPVPEPQGYAMLAAGLLLLGAVSRRKKSIQS